MLSMPSYFPPLTDIALLIYFLSMWFGYSLIADSYKTRRKGLIDVMYRYRYAWIARMPQRPHNERLSDIRIINNLIQANNFLASTSILIIGGLIAALLDGGNSLQTLQKAHLLDISTPSSWALKTGTAIGLFVYAFFKFTWVMRQFNYTAVLIMSVSHIPLPHDTARKRTRIRKEARRIALMLTNSAMHFNRAVRAFYFGLALICWYANDVLFIFACILVVATSYRREFNSRTLRMLRMT